MGLDGGSVIGWCGDCVGMALAGGKVLAGVGMVIATCACAQVRVKVGFTRWSGRWSGRCFFCGKVIAYQVRLEVVDIARVLAIYV